MTAGCNGSREEPDSFIQPPYQRSAQRLTALVSAAISIVCTPASVLSVRLMTVIWFRLNRRTCCGSSSRLCLHFSPLNSPLTSLQSLTPHLVCKSSLIHSQEHPGYIQTSRSVTMDICSRLTSRAPLSIAFTLAVFMAFAFRLSCRLPARTPSLVLFSFLWRPVILFQLPANEI